MIREVSTVNRGLVKLYFSSRQDSRFSNALENHRQVGVSEKATAQDVKAYIGRYVKDCLASHPVIANNPALLMEVEHELVTKVQGR